MVTQYFDILKFKPLPTPSVYDQNAGTYSTTSPSEFLEVKCRAEIKGEGDAKPSNDGVELKYSFIIYTPKTVPAFKYGQSVEVISPDGVKIFSGTVQAFKRGLFNARLWV